MLRIVTDGSADMPIDWAQKYQIEIIPLFVRFGEQIFAAGIDLGSDDFYSLVKQNHFIPKSSLPSPQQVIEIYRKIAKVGDEILSVHLGSKLSGTFSTIQLASNELKEEFKITTFDSGAGSAALGFMCRDARKLNQKGVSVKEIIYRLEEIRRHLAVIFTVDNLEFAKLSGRINTFQGAISSMLQIKPIIILRDGLLQVAEKVRTRQKSIDRIISYVSERFGKQPVNVAVVHAADPIMAQSIATRILELLNINEIVITELSIPVAANLGPGTIGIIAYPQNLEKD